VVGVVWEEDDKDFVGNAERLDWVERVAPADSVPIALPVCGTLDGVSRGEKDEIGAAESVAAIEAMPVGVAVSDESEAEAMEDRVGTPGVELTATTDTVATIVPVEVEDMTGEKDEVGVTESEARAVARLLPLPLEVKVDREEGVERPLAKEEGDTPVAVGMEEAPEERVGAEEDESMGELEALPAPTEIEGWEEGEGMEEDVADKETCAVPLAWVADPQDAVSKGVPVPSAPLIVGEDKCDGEGTRDWVT
jgi:hypothetical protein